jgi:hypothetical protein
MHIYSQSCFHNGSDSDVDSYDGSDNSKCCSWLSLLRNSRPLSVTFEHNNCHHMSCPFLVGVLILIFWFQTFILDK